MQKLCSGEQHRYNKYVTNTRFYYDKYRSLSNRDKQKNMPNFTNWNKNHLKEYRYNIVKRGRKNCQFVDEWKPIHTHHIVAPGFVDRPRRSDCTAGQMDGEAGWWTTSGNIVLPPPARVMGVGRQQQQKYITSKSIESDTM